MADVTESVLSDIAKTQEGVVLGLNALAEQLAKMNAINDKFVKAMDEEDEKEKEDNEKAEYERLVKSVTHDVLMELRKQSQQLLDGPKNVSGKTKWPMSRNTGPVEQEQDRSEVLDKNKREMGAQLPIEAMEKAESKEAAIAIAKQYLKDSHLTDKYPMVETPREDEDEEETANRVPAPTPDSAPVEDDQTKRVAKLIKELAKSQDEINLLKAKLTDLEKSIDAKADKAAAEKLRKAGFREEKGLAAPKLKSLGTDGVPIIKSSGKPEDLVSELSKLPWSELALLKEKVASGQTDGVPQELLNLG